MKSINLSLAFLLVAVAGVSHAELNIQRIKNPGLAIISVEVQEKDGIKLLTGELERLPFNSPVPDGHIDYTLSDINKNILASGSVNYNPPHGSRRWDFGTSHRYRYGSSFVIKLPVDIPDNASIKLQFHDGDHPNLPAINAGKTDLPEQKQKSIHF